MFQFQRGAQHLLVRSAAPADVDRLAQLYQTVQITAEQCHAALNAGDGSFMQRGGMFEINQSEDIERIVNDAAEKVFVVEFQDEIYGLIWFGLAKPDTFDDLIPLPEQRAAAEQVALARANGVCGFAKEIISVWDAPHELPYALFFAMMSDYVKNGIALTVGEVYTIDKYQTAGSVYESGLLNLASYRFLRDCSGVELGVTAQKRVPLEQFSVWKTPHILCWNTKHALTTIHRELTNKEWEIWEDEKEK